LNLLPRKGNHINNIDFIHEINLAKNTKMNGTKKILKKKNVTN
jgi:hypothetical protein